MLFPFIYDFNHSNLMRLLMRSHEILWNLSYETCLRFHRLMRKVQIPKISSQFLWDYAYEASRFHEISLMSTRCSKLVAWDLSHAASRSHDTRLTQGPMPNAYQRALAVHLGPANYDAFSWALDRRQKRHPVWLPRQSVLPVFVLLFRKPSVLISVLSLVTYLLRSHSEH